MIAITPHIAIDERELEENFVRSSGPGGQNVNKLATAVQLRFDLRGSPNIPPAMKARAEKIAGQRLTRDGVIVISADRFRTQEQNRDDARARLVELLQRAAIVPKVRRKTRPTLASKKRRIEGKKHRSEIKNRRGRPDLD
ncbi:MAG: aminoacyl-tRNA hydrolase [Xanthobacteraceae bacterium]|nr:aminoacyl-tRNA hydrolase [Xanthobacteraceae bacterium]MBX3550528.1 aminoacyl-tRNA hydrolase [Xanthobacteraceae bacterium]MCW5673695.1 aminoacyl-tRNA hydrolase [Xanthobacteraceae bacterium]MCW5678497.1 aminoacyl-tRNA hydrolase [Xanthobacteraceae bacterium]